MIPARRSRWGKLKQCIVLALVWFRKQTFGCELTLNAHLKSHTERAHYFSAKPHANFGWLSLGGYAQYLYLSINKLPQKYCLFFFVIGVDRKEPLTYTGLVSLELIHMRRGKCFWNWKSPSCSRLHPINNHISRFVEGRLNRREVWGNLLMFHPPQVYKLWEMACLRRVRFV